MRADLWSFAMGVDCGVHLTLDLLKKKREAGSLGWASSYYDARTRPTGQTMRT